MSSSGSNTTNSGSGTSSDSANNKDKGTITSSFVAPIPKALYYIVNQDTGLYLTVDGKWKKVDTQDQSYVFTFSLDTVSLFGIVAQYLTHYNTNKTLGMEAIPLVENYFAIFSSGNTTPIEFVNHGGLGYIYSTSEKKYLGLLEDTRSSDGCLLGWVNSYAPPIAISLIPAEEYEVTNVTLASTGQYNISESVLVAESSTFANYGPNTITKTFSTTYLESVTDTFTFSFTESLGVKVKTEGDVGVPMDGASVSITLSCKFSATQTQTTANTSSVSSTKSTTYPVPAGKMLHVNSTLSESKGDIDFTATFKSLTTGFTFQRSGTIHVQHYFKDQQQNWLTDVDGNPPSVEPSPPSSK